MFQRKAKPIQASFAKYPAMKKRFSLSGMALFGALLLSGCVGGPSAYMKEVSTEVASPQPVQLAQPQALLISPVQSAALDAPSNSEIPPAAYSAPETQQPIINSLQTTQAGSMMANLDNIGVNPEQPAQNLQASSQNQQPIPLQTAYQDPQLALLPTNQRQLASIDGIQQDGGFAIGAGGEPFVDPLEAAAESRIPILYANMKHGQCKAGRGPKPRKVNATNIKQGDPYYIEIRMRHTPLLPVGHTYVAYGRLSPSGQIIDEKLIMLAPFGGYAGAALASGIPMPGVLDPHPDDCRIRPKAAYRVSLNAQRYEKLLLDIQKARSEKPSYLLFTFNCNHFASRIAASVGIKPPANIYVPALEYIYAMIDENEGGKIARN